MPGAYMPAATIAGGTAMGVPDTCNVPAPPAGPIPTPFPNTAMLPMSSGTVPNVMIMNMPTVVQTSKVPMSNGDEAGVAGGIVSGMIMGEVAFRMASSKVKAKGKAVVMLTATTAHNGSNANCPAGVLMAPSQAKVLVAM